LVLVGTDEESLLFGELDWSLAWVDNLGVQGQVRWGTIIGRDLGDEHLNDFGDVWVGDVQIDLALEHSQYEWIEEWLVEPVLFTIHSSSLSNHINGLEVGVDVGFLVQFIEEEAINAKVE